MTVSFTSEGDIFATGVQAVGVPLSANGRAGASPFATALQDRYPAFVSDYGKRGRAGALSPGGLWLWRDAQPWLLGLIVRETPHRPTRLRFIEQAILNIYQDWQREGLHNLALPRLVDEPEWRSVRDMLGRYLDAPPLRVVVYEHVFAG